MPDNRQKIYNKLVNSGYKGTYEQFDEYLNGGDENISKVFKKLQSDGYKGTLEQFTEYAGIAPKRITVQDVESQNKDNAITFDRNTTSFDDWYQTVPADRNDTTNYNLRRAYELAPAEELEAWRTATPEELENGQKHLRSVYFNENGEGEFMKSKYHPTIQMELDEYEQNEDFRKRYGIDTNGTYYKYVSRGLDLDDMSMENAAKNIQQLEDVNHEIDVMDMGRASDIIYGGEFNEVKYNDLLYQQAILSDYISKLKGSEEYKRGVQEIHSFNDQFREENNLVRGDAMSKLRKHNFNLFGASGNMFMLEKFMHMSNIDMNMLAPGQEDMYNDAAADFAIYGAEQKVRLAEDELANGTGGFGTQFARGWRNSNWNKLDKQMTLNMALQAYKIAKKFDENGELLEGQTLSESETRLFKALQIAYLADNTVVETMWERIGENAPEQVKYTLEFILTSELMGASALSKGIAGAATRNIENQLAKKLVFKAVDYTAQPLLQTLYNPLNWMEGSIERQTGNLTYDENTGNFAFAGAQNEWDATRNAIVSAWIENFSEKIGEDIFKPAKYGNKYLRNMDNAFGRTYNQFATKIDVAIENAGLNKLDDVLKISKDIRLATGVQGIPGEYVEEVVGGIMDAMFVGDQSFHQYDENGNPNPNYLWNSEQQLETFLSCAVMSVGMTTVSNVRNGAVTAADRRKAKSYLNQMAKAMENQNIDTEAVDKAFENSTINDVSDIVFKMGSAEDMTDDKRQILANYVAAKINYAAMRNADMSAIEDSFSDIEKEAYASVNAETKDAGGAGGRIIQANVEVNGETFEGVPIVSGRVLTRIETDANGNDYMVLDTRGSSSVLYIRVPGEEKARPIYSSNVTGIVAATPVEQYIETQKNELTGMMTEMFGAQYDGGLPLEQLIAECAVLSDKEVQTGTIAVQQLEKGRKYNIVNPSTGELTEAEYVEDTENKSHVFSINGDNVELKDGELKESMLKYRLALAEESGAIDEAAQTELDALLREREADQATAPMTDDQFVETAVSNQVSKDDSGNYTPDSNPRAVAVDILMKSGYDVEKARLAIANTVNGLVAQVGAEEVSAPSIDENIVNNTKNNAEYNNALIEMYSQALTEMDLYVQNYVGEPEIGETYTLTNETGTVYGRFEGYDANGNVQYRETDESGENDGRLVVLPKNEFQKQRRAHNIEIQAQKPITIENAQEIAEETPVIPTETIAENAEENAVVPPVEEAPVKEEIKLPRDKDNNIDYKQITDPALYAKGLTEEFGDDAQSVIDELIADEKKNLEKAGTKNAIERRRAQKAAQSSIDFYNQVKNTLAPRPSDDAKVKNVAPKDSKAFEKRIAQAINEIGEPTSFEDEVLRRLANSSHQFKWGSDGTHKGMGAMLGFKGGGSEMISRASFLSKNGKYFDEVALDIWQDLPEAYNENHTDQEVRDLMIDFLRSYSNPFEMVDAIRQMQLGARNGETIDEAADRQQEESIESVAASYGMTVDEFNEAVYKANELNMSLDEYLAINYSKEEFVKEIALSDEQYENYTNFAAEQILAEEQGGQYDTGRTESDTELHQGEAETAQQGGIRPVVGESTGTGRERGNIGEEREVQQERNQHGSDELPDKGVAAEPYQPRSQRGKDRAVELDNAISAQRERVASARSEYDKAVGDFNKRNGLFGDTADNDDSLFGDLADFSKENFERISAEKQTKIENEQKRLDEIVAQRDNELREIDEAEDKQSALEFAEQEVDTNPTDAQKEAGNYKKGHVTIDGFDISIENPRGSVRSGVDENGNEWSVTMHDTYGYIRNTESVDGDHIDIFLSDHIGNWNGSVFVVDQIKPDGSFDEHKVMYGFDTEEEAREAYLANYSEGWQGLGTITEVSKEDFKKWVESSHRKTKPFSEYKNAQTQPVERKTATGQKIEDVGEKIGGARKDLAQKMSDKINLDADNFPKMFPKFDLKKLVEQGLDTRLAAAVMYLRQTAYDEYKRKKKHYNNKYALGSAKFFAAYAKFILEKGDTDVNFTDSGWVLTDYGKEVVEINIPLYSKLYDKLGNNMFELDLTDYQIIPIHPRAGEKHFRINAEGENEEFQPRYTATSKGASSKYFIEGELDKAIDHIISKVESAVSYNASHPYQLRHYYMPGVKDSDYIGVKLGGKVVPLTDRMSGTELRKYWNEHEAELQEKAKRLDDERKQKGGKKEDGEGKWKPELNLGGGRARVGEDYRNGRDIGADEFRETFGFRGVEFGNYVTQKERQRFLNETYDALMDMANLIGVSPKALSLGGQLGFAIGARGGGGKNAAHYEPAKNVINITKTNGAGSVAHEWWHALDYYFNKMGDKRAKPATGNNMTESFSDETREEMRRMFVALMDKINNSEYFNRSRALERKLHPNQTGTGYYDSPTELAARAFQDYVKRRLTDKGQVNDFLSSFTPEENWNGEPSTYPYPTGSDADAIDERFDKLFGAMEERTDENGSTELFSVSKDEMERLSIEKNIPKHVSDAFDELGIDKSNIHIVTDANQLPNAESDVYYYISNGYLVEGWYNTDTNEVYLYAPNLKSKQRTKEVILHELVSHKGLRGLLGQKDFEKLCDKVWKAMDTKTAQRMIAYLLYKDENHALSYEDYNKAVADINKQREAADEYMAKLSEKGIAEPSVWEKIRNFIVKALRKLGFDMDFTDADIRVLLRDSYGALSADGHRQTPANSTLNNVLYSIRVNHNSPHLLKKADGSFVDPETGERLGFDHRFMSTGEGSQAHGWGSYFSVNDIESYRQPSKTYKGVAVNSDPYSDNAADRALFYIEQEKGNRNAIKFLNELIKDEEDKSVILDYKDTIEVLKDEENWGESKGHNYTVEIPDNNGGNYIEESEPLTYNQYFKIKNAFTTNDQLSVFNDAFDDRIINGDNVTFMEIRRALTAKSWENDADFRVRDISKALSNAGFVGIHYNGQSDGECYVIFDENDAKIIDHVRFSITPQQDAAYMDAVERGDMETAHRMVMEAAERADYSSDSSYQGSLAFNGAAPNNNGYYETKEQRKQAFDNGELEGDYSLGDFVDNGVDGNDLGWQLANPIAASGRDKATLQSIRNLNDVVKNGKRTIKMYRAVDSNIKEDSFRNGDWVTPSREYAEQHIELQDWDGGRIIEQEVSIDDIWWNGDDINEWGYDDGNEYAYQNTKNNRKLLDAVTYDDEGNVIPLSKRFNKRSGDTRFSVANRNQAIFVSNAARAVEGIKQEKATPEQWLKMIERNGGLKAGEDKWLGLSDWLKDSNAKTLTKQQVLDFINENKIQIEEVKYSDNVDNSIDDEIVTYWREATGNNYDRAEQVNARLVEKYGERFSDAAEVWYDGGLRVKDQSLLTKIINGNDAMLPINSTRLEYTTSGLDNKREIALTVPTIESWGESDEIHFGDAGEGRAVAWVRFGETTDKDGNHVLVIDEIQSKRHQEGREKGYARKSNYTPENDVEKRIKSYIEYCMSLGDSFEDAVGYAYNQITDAPNESKGWTSEAVTKVKNAMKEEGIGNIPNAPFEKNWQELAMKRMLRLAAEEGYDKVAWTTGEQQAERYNLSQQVDEIKVSDRGNGNYIVVARKDGSVLMQEDVKGQDKLADVIGKELAQKAIAAFEEEDSELLDDEGTVVFDGDNLRIGGEGMKGFYDQMLPAFMNKYGKKWGVKVGEVTMPNLEEGYQTMHSIDITPEMKEDVMNGQTMFSIAPSESQSTETEAKPNVPESEDLSERQRIINTMMYYAQQREGGAITDEQVNKLNAEFDQSKQIAFNAVREALAKAGIEVVEATDEEVRSLRDKHVYLRSSNGTLRGWVDNENKIHLSKDGMNAETAVHEYTHIWVEGMRTNNLELWEQIRDMLIKDNPMYDEIKKSTAYSKIKNNDDKIAEEILARISGKQNAKRMEDAARQIMNENPGVEGAVQAATLLGRLRDALHKFWTWCGRTLFGKTGNITTEQVTEMVLADLVNGVNPDNTPGKGTGIKASVEGERVESEVIDMNTTLVSDILNNKLGIDNNDMRRKTIKRRLIDAKRKWMDSLDPLKKLQQSIAEATGKPLADFEDAYNAELRRASISLPMIERYTDDYLLPMIESVGDILKEGVDEKTLGLYLIAKHGLDRNEYFKKLNDWKEVQDMSGLTALAAELDRGDEDFTQVAKDFVNEIENTVPKDMLKNMWSRINDTTNAILAKYLESGLISKKQYDDYRKRYNNYVPLRGWDETTSDEFYNYSVLDPHFQSAIKQAKGRTSLANNVLANIMNMTESAVVIGEKNKVLQRLFNLAQGRKSDVLKTQRSWYVKNQQGEWEETLPIITEDMTPEQVKSIIEQFEQNMERMSALGEAKQSLNRADVGVKIKPFNVHEHYVPVFVNGRKHAIIINADPTIVKSLTDSNELANTKFVSALRNTTRFMSQLNTTFNPEFIVKNVLRDAGMAMISSYIEGGMKYANKVRSNINKFGYRYLGQLIRNGECDNTEITQYWKEFIENGGETGFTRTLNVDEQAKRLKKLYKKMLSGKDIDQKGMFETITSAIDSFNRWGEDLSRFAVFVTNRQIGKTVEQSVNMAKNATINFQRKGGGTLAAWFRTTRSFFNAGMQALYRFGSLAKNNPKRFAIASTAMVVSGLLVPALNIMMLSLCGGDDDDWNAYRFMSEFTGNHSWHMFVGDGFFTIPYPQEFAAFFAAGNIIFRHAIGWADDNSTIAGDIFNMALEQMPFDMGGGGSIDWKIMNAVTPQILQPFAEVYINEDFMGRPIYKKNPFNENDPNWTKAYKSTSGTLVELAKHLNSNDPVMKHSKFWDTFNNPAAWQHIITGEAGGIGRIVSNVSRLMENGYSSDNMPFLRNIYMTSDMSKFAPQVTRNYYNLLNGFDELNSYVNSYEKDGETMYENLDRYIKLKTSPEYMAYSATKDLTKRIKELQDNMKLMQAYDNMDEQVDNMRNTITGMQIMVLDITNNMIIDNGRPMTKQFREVIDGISNNEEE